MKEITGGAVNSKVYVIVTAAYNEDAYIEKLLASVVCQTILPKRWVIVSDGSTDRTDELVQRYADQYGFIQLYRVTEEHDRNFAAQVNAINTGFAQLKDLDYDYIGNLDADISLEPSYFARLLEKFDENPQLGLAGGFIYEKYSGAFRCRKSNSTRSVAHAVQLFRRECFRSLSVYLPLPYGGPDWHAEVSARMQGWRVEAFPHLPAFHHRATGTASGLWRYSYRQGWMDYSVGSHPFFEIVKLACRLAKRPYIVGAMARLAGFFCAYCRGGARPVSEEFVLFLRREQRARLRHLLAEL